MSVLIQCEEFSLQGIVTKHVSNEQGKENLKASSGIAVANEMVNFTGKEHLVGCGSRF